MKSNFTQFFNIYFSMNFKLFFFKQSGKEVLSIDAQCIIISKSVCKGNHDFQCIVWDSRYMYLKLLFLPDVWKIRLDVAIIHSNSISVILTCLFIGHSIIVKELMYLSFIVNKNQSLPTWWKKKLVHKWQ